MELHELTGATHDEILTVSAKTGEGVDDILEAIVTRTPPPKGDVDAAPRALIFDCEYDQYRGVIAYVRVIDGGFAKRQLVTPDEHRPGRRDRGDRLLRPRDEADRPARDRGGRLHHHRRQGRGAGARRRHHHGQEAPGRRSPAGLQGRAADGVHRPVPDRGRQLRGAPRRAREAHAERRGAHLRARDLGRARLRLPLRLPRPAAHGHRARAPGARVRPRAHHHDAQRRVPRVPDQREDDRGPQPRPDARGDATSITSRSPTSRPASSCPTEFVGHDHGALPGPPRRLRRHEVPLARARGDALQAAAGRDRARLLRPAQDAHARLRLARLRVLRLPARATWSSSTSCSPASRSTRSR